MKKLAKKLLATVLSMALFLSVMPTGLSNVSAADFSWSVGSRVDIPDWNYIDEAAGVWKEGSDVWMLADRGDHPYSNENLRIYRGTNMDNLVLQYTGNTWHSALKWVAPSNGTIDIKGNVKKINANNGDGIKVKIHKNPNTTNKI